MLFETVYTNAHLKKKLISKNFKALNSAKKSFFRNIGYIGNINFPYRIYL